MNVERGHRTVKRVIVQYSVVGYFTSEGCHFPSGKTCHQCICVCLHSVRPCMVSPSLFLPHFIFHFLWIPCQKAIWFLSWYYQLANSNKARACGQSREIRKHTSPSGMFACMQKISCVLKLPMPCDYCWSLWRLQQVCSSFNSNYFKAIAEHFSSFVVSATLAAFTNINTCILVEYCIISENQKLRYRT